MCVQVTPQRRQLRVELRDVGEGAALYAETVGLVGRHVLLQEKLFGKNLYGWQRTYGTHRFDQSRRDYV